MAISKFIPIRLKERSPKGVMDLLFDLQRRLEELWKLFSDYQHNGSILIKDLELTGGQINAIEHGLGRGWVGYEVHSCSVPVLLFPESTEATTRPVNTYLSLVPTADVTVTLAVY